MQREELLSFNDGNPFIITQKDNSDGNEKFGVLVFVRTISSPKPEYTSSIPLLLSFSPAFPIEPATIQLDQCQFFHPNFTDDGYWVDAELRNEESLFEFLMRLVRVLQYKDINVKHIANRNAMAWYNSHKNTDLFPTDAINYSAKPRISIHKINENAQADRIQLIQIGAIHYE